MIELGINVDHVATLRQARRTYEPDPVVAAALAEQGGADGITFHLREDRRHIQERDVQLLLQTVSVKTNFEIACNPEVLGIACRVRPTWALLVPEHRQEITTEGGLDLLSHHSRVADAIDQIRSAGILVSLFMDADPEQIAAALRLPIQAIELHTGPYAIARGEAQHEQLQRLREAAREIREAGIRVHAGHGLNYANVRPVARIENLAEVNIGHAIVSRALFVGFREAVAEMRRILDTIPPS